MANQIQQLFVDQDVTNTSAATDISQTETSSSEDEDELSSFETLRISNISQLVTNLPPKLDGLRIEECTYLEAIPKNLLHVMSTLKELYLIDCCSFKSFPQHGFLISLRTLYVSNCPKLEFFSSSEFIHKFQFLAHLTIGSSCDSLTVFTLDFFPKLKYLSLWNCFNLVSFKISEEFTGNLTSFKSLEIRDCPNLKSFPIGGLPTPNMASLFISNCKILKNTPNSKKSLLSLQSMILNECPALESLSLEASPNLSSLSISFCDKLIPLKSWGLYSFQYLSSFEIEGGCDGMESFPEEELLPNNINSLCISKLQSLKKLDYNGFKHLNALQELEINGCNQLHSLPEKRLPFSLQYLCINQSPLLTQKLSTKAGEDWNKIAHIPLIEIDGKEIS
ncbi:hypothetical protein OROGR_000670 [Orobanche gracilis]